MPPSTVTLTTVVFKSILSPPSKAPLLLLPGNFRHSASEMNDSLAPSQATGLLLLELNISSPIAGVLLRDLPYETKMLPAARGQKAETLALTTFSRRIVSLENRNRGMRQNILKQQIICLRFCPFGVISCNHITSNPIGLYATANLCHCFFNVLTTPNFKVLCVIRVFAMGNCCAFQF